MSKIYKKNEVTFAIICIVIYVVGTSIAESISETVGIVKLPSMIFHIGFSVILLAWLRKNDLFEKYGIVKPEYNLSKTWFFIPLMIVGLSSVFFGVKLNYSIPETAFYFEGIDIQKLNTSCNLIKGYIDNAEEAHKMLDFNIGLGVPRIGFVALMKVNDYCREHFVDLEEIHLESIPHVYFTRSMNRGGNCKCSNYLYNKDLKILEIYMRNYANPQYCESSLAYDGEYLRQGFHENNIIY